MRTPRGFWILPFPMFFAHRASGTAIGIVSSSRIAAAFLDPVSAATLLAWMPPGAVYLVLAGMGLLVVPLLAGLSGPAGAPKEART